MLFFKSLVALGAFSLVANAAIAPRTSPTPCTYSCPSKDEGNRSLVSFTTSSTKLTCKYNSSGTRNCVYYRSNGNLDDDNDYGDCYSKAQGSATCPQKRTLESKRQFAARYSKRSVSLTDSDREKLERRRNLRAAKGVRIIGRP